MKRDNLIKKKIGFLMTMFLFSAIFIIAYLILFGNTDEVYTDIVMEYVAHFSSAKTKERNLIYILIIAGIGVYLTWHLAVLKGDSGAKIRRSNTDEQSNSFPSYCIALFCTMMLVQHFIYQSYNQVLLIGILLFATTFYIDKKLVKHTICFYLLSLYGIQGFYCLSVYLGNKKTINYSIVSFLTLVLVGILFMFKNREKVISKAIFIAQGFLSFLWMILLERKYQYNNEIVIIEAPYLVKGFVAVMIIIALIELGLNIERFWKSETNVNRLVSISSCIAIMAYNNFSNTGAILPTDMHHPFENIIGFSQIFELGQKPFSEYIPVSGMYSVLHGWFFKFFGGGLISNYNVSTNVFYAFFMIAIVILLMCHLERSYVLLISVCFAILSSNRIIMVLPLMLLLSLPQMIEKKNLWLKVWFLSSFIHGLYYPLYGAAVCLGFMPLGIWQIITYIKSIDFKREIKTFKFWIFWLLTFLPAVLGTPLLIGTFKHTIAMSNQTIYADGVARFGQTIPANFLSYLSKDYQFIRTSLYYILSFLIPAAFIWIVVFLVLEVSGLKISRQKIKVENIMEICIMISTAIIPVISYTYTTVRLDPGSIYARSLGVLIAGSILLIVYAYRYIYSSTIKNLIFCFAVFVPALASSYGFLGNETKMMCCYTVPDDYVYLENETDFKLGTGFISQSLLENIQTQQNIELKKSNLNFGTMPFFGYYYIHDLKGISTIEIGATVKGYGAAKETIDILKKTKSLVGRHLGSWSNYYLYHWLVTSGDYLWSEENGMFIPTGEIVEISEKNFSGSFKTSGEITEGGCNQQPPYLRLRSNQEVRDINKNISIPAKILNMGRYPSSLGSSMKSLEKIFSIPDLKLQLKEEENRNIINFSSVIDGNEADWLYIEFADMDKDYEYISYDYSKEVKQEPDPLSKYLMKKDYNPGEFALITWTDDIGETNSIRCRMGKGKLLIPLGAGRNWLLHDHDSFSVSVERDGVQAEVPTIIDVQMLKLREVE